MSAVTVTNAAVTAATVTAATVTAATVTAATVTAATVTAATVTNAVPKPEVFYHPDSKTYYRKDGKGRWISVNENMTKKFLATQGHSSRLSEGDNISPADRCLLGIQDDQSVDYAAPLAGYMAGPYTINENRILVTGSPVLITPAAGEWPLLDRILEGMFNDPICDQRRYLFSWLKRSMEGFYAHTWTQGQVLAFAGPCGCGKSFFQWLLTQMFGRRSAKAYLYMSGRTSFNSELFQAEHLMVEDDRDSISYEERKDFGEFIKQVAANQYQPCNGKFKAGLTLDPHWRLTISLNDEPERLRILPPIDENGADKIMLFKVAKHEMPMPTANANELGLFQQAILKELPAFIDHLLNTWQIPTDIRSSRFGVTHYHHPDILEGLNELNPEQRLMELIDTGLFNTRIGPWDGSATELENILRNSPDCGRQAQALFKYNSACGIFLSNAARNCSIRVSKRILHGQTRYTIQPPPTETPSRFAGRGEGVGDFLDILKEKVYIGEGQKDVAIPAPSENVAIPSHPSHPGDDAAPDDRHGLPMPRVGDLNVNRN